jgi:hypothetical protein
MSICQLEKVGGYRLTRPVGLLAWRLLQPPTSDLRPRMSIDSHEELISHTCEERAFSVAVCFSKADSARW